MNSNNKLARNTVAVIVSAADKASSSTSNGDSLNSLALGACLVWVLEHFLVALCIEFWQFTSPNFESIK